LPEEVWKLLRGRRGLEWQMSNRERAEEAGLKKVEKIDICV
jgi:hypothetical protein